MNMHPMGPIYWRSVKADARTFALVRTEVQDSVRELARQDVAAGIITAADYERLIGEPFGEAAV